MRAILIGLLASFFFASTFIINRAMDMSGGSWIWSASLRYLFMVPFLVVIVMLRRNGKALRDEIRRSPGQWLLWSFVGFVLFYAPICFAAAYGPAWLVSGTWQFTIIAGSLLVPLFYQKVETPQGIMKQRQRIPFKEMSMSVIIVSGIFFMQADHATQVSMKEVLFGVIPVLIATFVYPLGNRKMMEITEGRLDAFQRVLGMTLFSVPFWIALSIYGIFTVGVPSSDQIVQTLIVAISSGVIATILFFTATDMSKGNPQQLASVEATQAGAVVFTVIGEVLLLNGEIPSGWALFGIMLVVIGMVLHSFFSKRLTINKVKIQNKISEQVET